MIEPPSFSRVLMVARTAPLALIGAVLALLTFHMAFGFVAMLGTIAMFGIIMRNSVILVDQIERTSTRVQSVERSPALPSPTSPERDRGAVVRR